MIKKRVNPLEESVSLKEGAGAGYSIKTDGFSVDVKSILSKEYDGDILKVKVDGNGKVDTFNAESYMYSTGDIDDLQIKVSEVWIDDEAMNLADIDDTELEKLIEDELDNADQSMVYGGGWSHVKYDGTISTLSDKEYINHNGWHDIRADIKLTDKNKIEWIDKAVSGENLYPEYNVLDENKDFVESFGVLDEAIEYAIENNYPYIEEVYLIETIDGDIDVTGNYRIVWENGKIKENLVTEAVSSKVSNEDIKDYIEKEYLSMYEDYGYIEMDELLDSIMNAIANDDESVMNVIAKNTLWGRTPVEGNNIESDNIFDFGREVIRENVERFILDNEELWIKAFRRLSK